MSVGPTDPGSGVPPQSALIVRVPEAEPYVADLRARFDPVASRGVPAHVTILVPFVPPARIDADVLRRLRAALAGTREFAFRLAEVRGQIREALRRFGDSSAELAEANQTVDDVVGKWRSANASRA